MLEKRKAFIINTVYIGLITLGSFLLIRFTFKHLMPFIVGFMIAFLLKPIVRKLDDVFGKNKWISIIVTILFYATILFVVIWLILGGVALIQHYMPTIEDYFTTIILPMANDLFDWFEVIVRDLDPRISGVIEKALTDFASAFEVLINYVSKFAISSVTTLVSSTPKILISMILSIISSFFFSVDYEEIVSSMLNILPDKVAELILDFKRNFTELISKFFRAYGKLLSLTFVELLIGFLILRVKTPFRLAFLIALVDILPILGTGTVLWPWALYEFALGSSTLSLGLILLYIFIVSVRYYLEPKVIGNEIGLHPLTTLISIYLGLKFIGFWGIFIAPIVVTILMNMHRENKFNIKEIFNG